MNSFGGNWTEDKIEILVEYASAYLAIMNNYADKYKWKLMYFDGFAGSGFIEKGKEHEQEYIIGACKRILDIKTPRSFDTYYFVEKGVTNAIDLRANLTPIEKGKLFIVNEDCNTKIHSLATFLKSPKGKNHKVLAYIDPCGMQLNWDSLVALKDAKIDAWILVPTGIGVNRLLKKNGNISDKWLEKLEVFLGMRKEEILSYFYNQSVQHTLFGEEVVTTKEEKALRNRRFYMATD